MFKIYHYSSMNLIKRLKETDENIKAVNYFKKYSKPTSSFFALLIDYINLINGNDDQIVNLLTNLDITNIHIILNSCKTLVLPAIPIQNFF